MKRTNDVLWGFVFGLAFTLSATAIAARGMGLGTLFVDGLPVADLTRVVYHVDTGNLFVETDALIIGCQADRLHWDRFEGEVTP